MKFEFTIATSYKEALKTSVVLQIITFVVCGLILHPLPNQIAMMAFAGYAPAVMWVIVRRPESPTKCDIHFVSGGFLLALFLAGILVTFIWRWRGLL